MSIRFKSRTLRATQLLKPTLREIWKNAVDAGPRGFDVPK